MSPDKAPKIGVLGGTFDPIHIGHLRPALEVQQQFAMDQMRLLPCHLTSHRAQPARSASVRSHMAALAAAELPGFSVDERELRREALSYTVDTLAEMRAELPHARLYFLLGADSFDNFQHWHRWRDILDHAQLIVMARPGTQLGAEAKALLAQRGDRINIAHTTELRVSSTAIRSQLAQGQDPRYLLPEPVRDYIHTHHLYLEST